MSSLEQLENELSLPVQAMLDKALPEPDRGHLLKIEQSLPLMKKTNRLIPFWLILLLGVTGIASAFWLANVTRDKSPPIKPAHETIADEPEKSDQSASDSNKQHQQVDGVENKNSSPVIYRREALGNE